MELKLYIQICEMGLKSSLEGNFKSEKLIYKKKKMAKGK